MRILITNHRIAHHTGTELYVCEISEGLLHRGHQVLVYTPNPGPLAEDLRNRGVPVTDRLETLGDPPDVIHAHHHLPAMAAALAFPQTPVFFFCHGWTPWEENPALLPNILHFGATAKHTRDRLCLEHGVPEERVSILANFVDVDRFQPRTDPLPASPARALVFSNYFRKGKQKDAVDEACAKHSIGVEYVGAHFERIEPNPEKILENYDIVFAQGRSALEAAATGAAVVVLGEKAMGEMILPENFQDLQDCNFGLRALRMAINPKNVELQLSRYSPQTAAEVSTRVRTHNTLPCYLDKLVALYEALVDQGVPADEHTVNHALTETSRYLQWLTRELSRQERAPHEREETRMSRLLQELSAEKDRCKNYRTRFEQEREKNKKTRKKAHSTRKRFFKKS